MPRDFTRTRDPFATDITQGQQPTGPPLPKASGGIPQILTGKGEIRSISFEQKFSINVANNVFINPAIAEIGGLIGGLFLGKAIGSGIAFTRKSTLCAMERPFLLRIRNYSINLKVLNLVTPVFALASQILVGLWDNFTFGDILQSEVTNLPINQPFSEIGARIVFPDLRFDEFKGINKLTDYLNGVFFYYQFYINNTDVGADTLRVLQNVTYEVIDL